VLLAAREALVEFNLALRWAGGHEPEAWLGIGRCQELLGDDAKAEEAYQEASSLPPAKSALGWLWARRLLEGRRDKDWKAQIAAKAEPTHRARLLAEGKWEEVLATRPEERDDGLADLVQGAAAIELKQWDEALRRLDDALRIRPRDSTILYYKGMALAGKGDRAGASAAWSQALQHKPKDWPLQSELLKRQSALPQ
jgi:Flp pilus assembly protein TadD